MSDKPMNQPSSQLLNEPSNETSTGVVTMYTTSWCGDCQVAKRFLAKFAIPYREVDIEHDPAAAELVMRLNDGRRSVPTLVYEGDATSLSGFSRAKLDAFLQRHDLLPS